MVRRAARARRRTRLGVAAVAVVVCGATAMTACTAQAVRLDAAGAGQGGAASAADRPPSASTRVPPAASVLANTAPDALTAAFARLLFKSAPVVVVAASTHGALPAASQAAMAAHAPLLLLRAGAVRAPLTAEIKSLHPSTVLAVGLSRAARAALAARLPGVLVVTGAAQLPVTSAPTALRGVAVLVRAPATGAAGAAASVAVADAGAAGVGAAGVDAAAAASALAAVTATARVAGAVVVAVAGYDPRADPAAIRALAKARTREVVAIGSGFGPAARLASRVAVAATGTQLPGGGQLVFPGHRLVALYGNPAAPSLGVLGHQDLAASIARARQTAAQYRKLSKVPVVPAFEIIATVAQASAGPDGSYSYETPVSTLLPWVRAANAAGLYVILDLQAGRASLLAQAEHYQSLLALPDVGLALDPEWKLQPWQLPLQQIGSVSAAQVNVVVRWLAALTARHHLPQKVLVLHQFSLAMITNERAIDTTQDNLAILIHMDGQGSPGDKQQTWDAVTSAAPARVFFGWKNFYVEDHPMLSPQATMARTPQPVMISYQ